MSKELKNIKRIADIKKDTQGALYDHILENEGEHDKFDRDIKTLDKKIENKSMTPGPQGERGEVGPEGPQGATGEPGKPGKDGVDGIDGKDGKDGLDGQIGEKGDKGDKGDTPDHKWEGTKLFFEKPDKTWGLGVDLLGPTGKKGKSGKPMVGSIFGQGFGGNSPIAIKENGTLLSDAIQTIDFRGDDVTLTQVGQDMRVEVNTIEAINHTQLKDMPDVGGTNADHDTRYLNLSGENGEQSYIDFDTSASAAVQEGRLIWNDDDGTLNLGLKGGNVNLQIGQEIVIRAKASEAISNGELVYIDGADGTNPTMSLAKADDVATSKDTIAMATEDIGNGQLGYVTTFGLVRNISVPTATFSDGDTLYLSADTAGSFTNVKPELPNNTIKIGYVLRAHDIEGDVFVNINQRTNSCENIRTKTVDGATVVNQCQWNNDFGSTGRRSGGTVTDAGSEIVDVAAGTGYIKATDSDTAELLAFDWSASSGISIPTDTIRYIGVEYNSGSPQVVTKITDTWNLDTEFPLAKVTNEGGTLHILNNYWWVTDGITNIIERLQAEGEIVRDDRFGGLALSVPGTRNIAVTAGVLWSRLNEFDISALDTSVTGTFEYYWYNGVAGTWNDSAETQYSVTQWNDTTLATLQTLTNNWYANLWVYAEADNSEIAILYPQAQYANVATAEAESPPTLLPTHISENAILIGRILIKQGTDAPVEVQSAFDTIFNPAQAATHNNLAGLQGGTTGEYYHLTSAEATVVSNTSGTNTGDEPSASDSVAGVVELATITETDTGTDATRAVTPDGLQGSFRNLRFLVFTIFDSEVDVETGTDLIGDFVVPFDCTIIQDDNNKEYFNAATDTAGVTGTMVVDVNLNGTTIMTTNKLDIETGEKSTTTATTQPDLTTTDVSAGDILTFDVDAIHSGTAAKGLKVYIAVRPD